MNPLVVDRTIMKFTGHGPFGDAEMTIGFKLVALICLYATYTTERAAKAPATRATGILLNEMDRSYSR